MQQVDLLINASWVLPIRPQNIVLTDHSVAISAGKIIDYMPTVIAKKTFKAAKNVDMPGKAIMPGLINCHTHAAMNIYRSMADDLPLMEWLNAHIWPAEKACANQETIHLGSKLAIAEMLRSGITCFNDHYFFPQVTAEVAINMGMRASIGLQMMDVATIWAPDAITALEKGLDIYKTHKQHDLLTWTLAPHAPYTISDKTLQSIREAQIEHGLKAHIHLHETQDEIKMSMQEHKIRPIERLDNFGLINPDLIAVHMTQLCDNEIQLIADNKSSIVHCPQSNMKLASGFMPTCKLKDAGVNIALGTDGAVSNNDLDMLTEMRSAIFAANASHLNPTALTAPEAIEMATINGAKALGLDAKTGSIEVGKAADIIAIDLEDWLVAPTYNPQSQIAYAIDRRNVSHVWVAGVQVVENGVVANFDSESTLAELNELKKTVQQFV
jgi:5-methylthioadenosine/S-adenosylhomocysteine deaminase